MATGPSDWKGIAFMVVWMVFWAAGMIIATVALGGVALQGEIAPILFLTVWLGAAGFGLYNAARTLRALLMGETKQRRSSRVTEWHDGISDRSDKP